MLALVLMNHMTNKKKSILVIVDEKQGKGFNSISFMQEIGIDRTSNIRDGIRF